MATITQLQPTLDTVVSGLSGTYSNQINVFGGIAPYLFETTVPSADVIVLPNGEVQSTGVLGNGTYTVSGNVTDLYGNSGTWTFTLTVTGAISPQTSVVPFTTALPTGSEIAVPFHIDSATGGVAVLTSYLDIINQHLATIIMTTPLERLMNPGYGAGVEEYIFRPADDLQAALLQSDIQAQISAFEPDVQIINISAAVVPGSPTQINVMVSYSVVPFEGTNTVTVTTGGTVTQVNAS